MQRYFSQKKIDNNFVLNEEDLYHIKKVMRMNNGSKIEVVYDNNLYICKLNNNLATIEQVKESFLKRGYSVLVIPILQEQKMSLILQKATELGVDEIIPILTTRSKVKIEENQDKKMLRWKRICKEAAEQSKRISIPIIGDITTIDNLELDGLKLVCSTKEKVNTLKKVLKNNSNCDKIIMGFGPEGGLTLEEEDKLVQKGFIPISLGNNIMRVETVPIFLLSVLNYEIME